jgi:arylsulfatase
VLNRAHSLTAKVEIPKGGAEGVVVCHGTNCGGYTLFVKDGKLHYVHNYVGAQEFHLASTAAVPTGKVELRYEFEPTGKPDIAAGKGTPGKGSLYINGRPAGEMTLPFTVPLIMALGGGLSVGCNPGSAASVLYQPPFNFTGTIFEVVADVSGKAYQDEEQEKNAHARAAMARQ